MDSKYKYTYERTANYCYKDSDVLIWEVTLNLNICNLHNRSVGNI